ncbi:sporulation protein YpjB [Caldifermentibacillus hisashii]|uniref:sporulation protein YpjB n=1 Tax=Caldifermentibacillus hisashii TaxID=996558 RepID=UPI0031FBB086
MKQLVILLTLFTFLIGPVNGVQAVENGSDLNTLDMLANEALQLSKAQRYEETQKVLKNIGEILEHTNDISADEKRILQVSHHESVRTIENGTFTNEEIVNRLTKFRLVVDAVITDYEPLWTNMESSVLTAFQSVKEKIEQKDYQHFHEEFNRFLSVYDIVYPSIMLDVPVEKVQKVDAQLQYWEQYSNKLLNSDDGLEAIETLQKDLQSLFENAEEDEADLSLWWVIISTGGIIILTLSYVGWKKYKAERAAHKAAKKGQKN